MHCADRRDLRPGRDLGEGRARTARGVSVGWICGAPDDYDREYCVDLSQLSAFMRETQPDVVDALGLEQAGPTRRKFLARLQGEINEARHDRRAAAWTQARAASPRPLLRHALAG